MDHRLSERLKKWNDQADKLQLAEKEYLMLEAQEKSLYASLYAEHDGSIEDRKQKAFDSKAWCDFAEGLAQARAFYLDQRRRYDMQAKAFDATYLEVKHDLQQIARQP